MESDILSQQFGGTSGAMLIELVSVVVVWGALLAGLLVSFAPLLSKLFSTRR